MLEKHGTFKKSFDILMLLFLLCSAASLVLAETWTQVTQFTGYNTRSDWTQIITTNQFTVTGSWRITYTFQFKEQYAEGPNFAFYVYDEAGALTAEKLETETIGDNTININYPGTFYLKIQITNTQLYIITVEQNADSSSTPEFGTLGIMMLVMLLTGSFIIAVRKRKGLSEKE